MIGSFSLTLRLRQSYIVPIHWAKAKCGHFFHFLYKTFTSFQSCFYFHYNLSNSDWKGWQAIYVKETDSHAFKIHKMYLHCKNIFIEGQTFAEETGDNSRPGTMFGARAIQRRREKEEELKVWSLNLIQKTKRSMDATAEFQSCSCSVMYNDWLTDRC